MPFDKAKAVGVIRSRLGSPLDFEITDADIENAIDASIVEYSRLRPRLREIQLPLWQDRDYYDLDSDVIDVVDCILAFNGGYQDYTISPEFPYNEYDKEAYRFSSSPHASERQVDEIANEVFDRYKGYAWEFLADEGKLRITPTPRVGGNTWIKVAYMHTAETFPARDIEIMYLYALGEAMETLGRFRSKVKELPTGVGYKMKLDGGALLMAEAKEKKKQFYDIFFTGGTPVTAG